MRKKIINLSILCIITFFCVFFVYRLWEKDFSVPLFFDQDGVGALLTIKNVIMGESIWNLGNLNAPHSEPSYLVDFIMQGCIIKILALFIKDVGIVANSYWILTYLFTAITTFYLLQRCKCNVPISFIGALAYAFLPYHYYRTTHFWLMGLYMIPVGIYLILDILEYTGTGSAALSRKKPIKYILICLLFGMNGLYYSFFLAIFLLFALLVKFVSIKSKYLIYAGIGLTITLLLPAFLFMAVPAIFGLSAEASGLVDGRTLYQMNYYALCPMVLLLPIPEHRIDAISKWTAQLYTELNIYAEQYTAHLGTFMAVGLIISLFYFFVKGNEKESESQIISFFGKMNAFAILLGSSGGFCLLIGIFVTSSIRCFNRISVFIAIFSDIAACVFLQYLYNKFKAEKKRKTILLYLSCILLSLFCVLDQTTSAFADFSAYDIEHRQYVRSYAENEYEYRSLEAFIQSIEKHMDEQTRILQFPLVSESSQFRQSRVAVVSEKINWSSTVTANGNYYWLKNLSASNYKRIIDIAILYDFKGILIDSSCYQDYNVFLQEKEELEQLLMIAPEVNPEEDLFYYSFDSYLPVFEAAYHNCDHETLRTLLEDVLNDPLCSNYTADTYFLSGADSSVETISRGDLQYGPYVYLESGEYQVNIIGNNLSDSSFYCTAQNGRQNISITDWVITDNHIQYSIRIESPTENVEFLLRNNNDDMNVLLFTYKKIN